MALVAVVWCGFEYLAQEFLHTACVAKKKKNTQNTPKTEPEIPIATLIKKIKKIISVNHLLSWKPNCKKTV